jgi:hypothetical protein
MRRCNVPCGARSKQAFHSISGAWKNFSMSSYCPDLSSSRVLRRLENSFRLPISITFAMRVQKSSTRS